MITGTGVSINLGADSEIIAAVSCAFLLFVGCLLTAIYARKKKSSEAFSLTSYILLGWFCVLPITGILGDNMYRDTVNTHLIILGGILYSAGILYYARDSVKWNHTKWHLFVMAGYLTHLAAHYRVVSNIV